MNWELQTTDPGTGVSPYNKRAYQHSVTVTIPEDMARIKTKADLRLRDEIKASKATGVSEDFCRKSKTN